MKQFDCPIFSSSLPVLGGSALAHPQLELRITPTAALQTARSLLSSSESLHQSQTVNFPIFITCKLVINKMITGIPIDILEIRPS